MTVIEILNDSLVGKTIKHMNAHRREVSLEVEDVKVKRNHRQITPDTRENDWYGKTCSWDTIEITFIDGSKIEVQLGSDINIV